MPHLAESHTLVIERNTRWEGEFATEPAETAWAREAIFFVRALQLEGALAAARVRVQLSPDGMHWADEGTLCPLPGAPGGLTFCRLTHFGGWLRLVGSLPAGTQLRVIVYLNLKG
ncbi:MAG: hypothetical protein HC915_01685 [Anaerolineae bacterium]|nr:hypothetical protein [Anaerolineae bacterium]